MTRGERRSTQDQDVYELLVGHLAATTSLDEERALRRLVAEDVETRALFTLLLSAEDQQADGDGLAARQARHARTLFPPKAPTRRLPRWLPSLALAASLCAVALVVAFQLSPYLGSDRGAGALSPKPAASSPDRYVSVVAYRRASGAERFVEAKGWLRSDDALAFAYSNGGSNPYSHLMLFGLDEQLRVYWYYPAFSDPSSNPVSIRVAGGDDLELPDHISHRYEGRRLRLFALFSRKPLDVAGVEKTAARLRDDGGDIERLTRFPLGDTGQHSLLLEVRR